MFLNTVTIAQEKYINSTKPLLHINIHDHISTMTAGVKCKKRCKQVFTTGCWAGRQLQIFIMLDICWLVDLRLSMPGVTLVTKWLTFNLPLSILSRWRAGSCHALTGCPTEWQYQIPFWSPEAARSGCSGTAASVRTHIRTFNSLPTTVTYAAVPATSPASFLVTRAMASFFTLLSPDLQSVSH